jgi:hypothetical protein
MMMLRRYLPPIVLFICVILISAGVSEDVMRVPTMVALGGSIMVFAPAEMHNVRHERRTGEHRSGDDRPPA